MSIRDRPSTAREGKLGQKVYLHPHLEQGGKQRCWLPLFLSYRCEILKVPDSHPWTVSWKTGISLTPQSLKKTCLTFFFKSAQPHHPLESSRQWPVEGSLSHDTGLQLDGFCRRQRKWVEVPCVPLFLSARYARLMSSGHKVCPKGTDVGVKPSAPSCPYYSAFASVFRAHSWARWRSRKPSGKGCLSLGRSSNNPSSNTASDCFGFSRNSDSQSRGGADNQN